LPLSEFKLCRETENDLIIGTRGLFHNGYWYQSKHFLGLKNFEIPSPVHQKRRTKTHRTFCGLLYRTLQRKKKRAYRNAKPEHGSAIAAFYRK
jgi:hypothetical protein